MQRIARIDEWARSGKLDAFDCVVGVCRTAYRSKAEFVPTSGPLDPSVLHTACICGMDPMTGTAFRAESPSPSHYLMCSSMHRQCRITPPRVTRRARTEVPRRARRPIGHAREAHQRQRRASHWKGRTFRGPRGSVPRDESGPARSTAIDSCGGLPHQTSSLRVQSSNSQPTGRVFYCEAGWKGLSRRKESPRLYQSSERGETITNGVSPRRPLQPRCAGRTASMVGTSAPCVATGYK